MKIDPDTYRQRHPMLQDFIFISLFSVVGVLSTVADQGQVYFDFKNAILFRTSFFGVHFISAFSAEQNIYL